MPCGSVTHVHAYPGAVPIPLQLPPFKQGPLAQLDESIAIIDSQFFPVYTIDGSEVVAQAQLYPDEVTKHVPPFKHVDEVHV